MNESFLILQVDIINPVRQALDYYTEMQKALEEEKKKRESTEEITKQNGITKTSSQNKIPS